MRAAVDRYVWSNQRPSADRYKAGVDDCAVEVDKDTFANADIGAVVDVDWCFDPGIVCKERLVCVFCGGRGREWGGVCYDAVGWKMVINIASRYVAESLPFVSCHLRFPKLDLLSACCEACVVELRASYSATSPGFDEFWGESVVELATQ